MMAPYTSIKGDYCGKKDRNKTNCGIYDGIKKIKSTLHPVTLTHFLNHPFAFWVVPYFTTKYQLILFVLGQMGVKLSLTNKGKLIFIRE